MRYFPSLFSEWFIACILSSEICGVNLTVPSGCIPVHCKAFDARVDDERQAGTSHKLRNTMITLPSLLFNSLWILGLAGALATMSYMNWYRSENKWKWSHMVSVARTLVPLSLSLVLFCSGMALSGVASAWPAPWWQTFAWSALTMLFAVQGAQYVRVGRRHGWDAPIEGTKHV